MSENKTPKTPNVIVGETVPTTEPTAPAPAPKAPGKFKTTITHPIAAIKRHKTAATLALGAVAGSVATMLLSKDGSEKPVSSVANASENDTVLFLVETND